MKNAAIRNLRVASPSNCTTLPLEEKEEARELQLCRLFVQFCALLRENALPAVLHALEDETTTAAAWDGSATNARCIFVACQLQAFVRRWLMGAAVCGVKNVANLARLAQKHIRTALQLQTVAHSSQNVSTGTENSHNTPQKACNEAAAAKKANGTLRRALKTPRSAPHALPHEDASAAAADSSAQNLYCLRKKSLERAAASSPFSVADQAAFVAEDASSSAKKTEQPPPSPLSGISRLKAQISMQAKINQLTRQNTALNEGYKHCIVLYRDRYVQETPPSPSLRLSQRMALRAANALKSQPETQLSAPMCDASQTFSSANSGAAARRVTWASQLTHVFDGGSDGGKSSGSFASRKASILRASDGKPLLFAHVPPQPTVVEVQNVVVGTRSGDAATSGTKKFKKNSSVASSRPKKKKI